MAKIVFVNANEPEQPRKGVYGWFCTIDGMERAVYIGRAGGNAKSRSVAMPSTLCRGIQEARRSALSTDEKRKALDTDFIVGSALLYLKGEGHDCCWKHLSDDPRDEKTFREKHKPMLQRTSTSISRVFRISKPDKGRWENRDAPLAEQLLASVFKEHLA